MVVTSDSDKSGGHINCNYYSDYAGSGEATDTHSEQAVNQAISPEQWKWLYHDISGVFSSLSADDVFGFYLRHNCTDTDALYVLGVLLSYGT